MKRRNTDSTATLVMTYDQWHKEYKRRIRRRFRKMVSVCFQWIILSIMFAGLPIGMLIHWVAVGY